MIIHENSKPTQKMKAWYLFTEDFVAGTQHLTNEEVGIYIRLLCFNWNKRCSGIPNDSETQYRIANCFTDNEKKSCDIKPVLLCCGQGMSAVFPGNSENQPIIPTPSTANLGQVSVNTAGLCKPVVEIEFSSIVSLINTNNQFGKAALSFQLFRACDEEEARSGGPRRLCQFGQEHELIRILCHPRPVSAMRRQARGLRRSH